MPLTEASLKQLRDIGTIKTYKEGEIIINEHSYIRSIPIVLKGSVKVLQIDEEDGEILLYYIQPGESCIMSFIGGMYNQPSKIRAIANEDLEILLIPIERSAALMKENNEWLDYIFALYHKRFEELLEVVNAITFKKMDVRILNLLDEKRKLNKSPEITITHQQLANELGTAREVVSRLLKQLENSGRLKLGRNKILLL